MNHYDIWNAGRPIEPEQCRFVRNIERVPDDLPDYLFAVPNDDGTFGLFVTPPKLPKSELVITFVPYAVHKVYHMGTGHVPYDHLYAVAQAESPDLPELFMQTHPVRFMLITTDGLEEMNHFVMQGFRHAVDPNSVFRPEALLLHLAAKFVISGMNSCGTCSCSQS